MPLPLLTEKDILFSLVMTNSVISNITLLLIVMVEIVKTER